MPEINNVLFYVPLTDAGSLLAKVHQIIETLELENQSGIYRTTRSLIRGLSRYETRPGIAVIMATCKKDLSELLSIQDHLHDLRIILALPDREADTVTQGYRLRPRVLTYVDGNFDDIAAILHRMRNGHPKEDGNNGR